MMPSPAASAASPRRPAASLGTPASSLGTPATSLGTPAASLGTLAASPRVLAGLLVLGLLAAGCSNKPDFEDVPPPEELYAKGQQLLEGRKILGVYNWVQYDKAIETFQAIIDNYPYSEYEIEAQLKIADAYFDDGSYDEALSYYRDFADLHPQNERVPYTVLRSALCHSRS
jgi:outer membrane protein assembly factor BamD